MTPDYLPLVVIQRTAFLQDSFGYFEFANIMEQRARSDLLQIVAIVNAPSLRQYYAEVSDIGWVRERMVIVMQYLQQFRDHRVRLEYQLNRLNGELPGGIYHVL